MIGGITVVAKFEFRDRETAQMAARKCKGLELGTSVAYLNIVEILSCTQALTKLHNICMESGGRERVLPPPAEKMAMKA